MPVWLRRQSPDPRLDTGVQWRAKISLQRYGKAEESAAAVVFLLPDGGAYITAQNVRVDGGLTRSV